MYSSGLIDGSKDQALDGLMLPCLSRLEDEIVSGENAFDVGSTYVAVGWGVGVVGEGNQPLFVLVVYKS